MRRRKLTGRTVVVHTRRPDDQTIRGVVHGDHRDRLVLVEALYVSAPAKEQPLGGLVHIYRDNIAFIQEP